MSAEDDLDREMTALEDAARRAKATGHVRRGRHHLEERARRVAQKKQAISLRLDRDVLDRLKVIAGSGSYQSLMNRILAQWCDAMEFGELIEGKLDRLERATKQLEQILSDDRKVAG